MNNDYIIKAKYCYINNNKPYCLIYFPSGIEVLFFLFYKKIVDKKAIGSLKILGKKVEVKRTSYKDLIQ